MDKPSNPMHPTILKGESEPDPVLRFVTPHIAQQRADMRIPNDLRLASSGVWYFRQRLSSHQTRKTGKHEVT
jgi:hypothetical protein